MQNWVRKVMTVGLLLAGLPLGTAWAMPSIMTIGELQPGMVGVAKTVMKGTDIDTFTVEILGVEENGKGMHAQILARASGPIVDATGGVIHGMSGSPVYVDGRVIGAVARGIAAETDPHVFYITPIEDMLKIWDSPDRKQPGQLPQVDLKAALQEGPDAAKAEEPKDKAPKVVPAEKVQAPAAASLPAVSGGMKAPAQQKTAHPAATPLLVSGFTDASLDFLRQGLSPFALEPYNGMAAGGSAQVVRNATLEPGSSVAAALVFGDFTVGATGTVTAVDGSRMVAFGHPYTYRGNVNYFMMDADVIGAAGSLTNGTKIANFGNVIGRINQDRYAGISGVLGSFPAVVPIKVAVEDAQNGRHVEYSAQIAYDEDLLPTLGAAIAYASVDKTIDRQGEGSAKVSFEILTNAAAGGKLERSNMFYNGSDVGPLAVSEIGQALSLICSNDENESDVLGIKVRVQMNEARQTASLVEAVPDKMKVQPGDTVHLKVKLKPYRQPAEAVDIPYVVPASQAPGQLNLELRGGGLISVAQILQQQGLLLGGEIEVRQPLEEQIKNFVEANKNNEIIVAPAPLAAGPLLDEKAQMEAIQQAVEQSKQLETADSKKPKIAAEPTRFETKYIVDNLTHVSLQVEKKK